jgi:hypothetical protein
MSVSLRFPCPCCGYRVFQRPPGNHEKCPVCLWEDDLSQLRFPATAPALLSAAVPDAALPPPSMESYLPTSL